MQVFSFFSTRVHNSHGDGKYLESSLRNEYASLTVNTSLKLSFMVVMLFY